LVKAPGSVLVVDDERVIRDLLVQIITREGYVVDQACDGLEALKKLEDRWFDYIISDIQMPNMDGLTLLKKVRSLHPSIRVLMITGQTARFSAGQATAAGADGFIAKPFKNTEIARTLAELSARATGHAAQGIVKPKAGK
jgi:CheY-like chemotaxis protein